MSTGNRSKINQLLGLQPPGVVFQSSWLAERGYSYELQKRYRKSAWLESIGAGALIRFGDRVGYEGAILALQQQTNSSIHPGGRTALLLLGKAHYLELETKKAVLFGDISEKLPAWFHKHDWGVKIEYYRSSFLPSNLDMTDVELKNFSIKVSGAARALMECLYLVPKNQNLVECYELMEGLNNIKPDKIQNLLENCRSIKVKRLFLYLAEKAGHSWFRYLKTNRIDLGSGKRRIVENGVYVDEYQITVPKELEANETGII